jgi:ubiquinone/menaquinone biosynthesis C-methylase UbiE
MDPNNNYTSMQKYSYENDAYHWSLDNMNAVVGSFASHNSWGDYEYLFKDIPNQENLKVLDFGCGPARNIVKYNSRFNKIDGVDIAQNCLEKAKVWLEYNNIDPNSKNLYLCNGVDLSIIEDSQYDVIMSTITFQHICVYDIRFNYLKEFYRILNPGGYITIQMGYGENSPQTVDYYENYYNASGTNRACDTNVKNPEELETDLVKIGFTNFKYYICSTGPGDYHPNWIFFSAQKV